MRFSTRSAGLRPICGCPSPTGATCGAPTACRAEGLDWLPDDEVLTDDEVVRLISVAVERLGVERGALHRGRAAAAPRAASTSSRRTAALQPRPEISITTNALGLTRTAAARCARRGWTGSTSGWTPCAPRTSARSPAATGFTTWSQGLEAAAAAGPRPGQGQRGADARGQRRRRRPSCCAGAWSAGYELRFIEQMPLDAQHGWNRDGHGHRRRDLRLAGAPSSALEPAEEPRGSAPAELFTRRRRPGRPSA